MNTTQNALTLALEALEQIARLTGPRWALENSYAGHLEAITALREALDHIANAGKVIEQPAQRKPTTNFDRFNGVDIQYRRGGTNWPAPYRVRITSNKNERDEFRATLFCDSLDEAIEAAHGVKP